MPPKKVKKKQPSIKIQGTLYFLEYQEREYITRMRDPQDRWDQDDCGLEYNLLNVHKNKIKYPSHSLEIPGHYKCWHGNVAKWDDVAIGDEIYIVHAHYTTGGTFGSYETFEIMGALSTKVKADNYIKQLKKGEINKYSSEQYSAYLPWMGYFESLISLHIDSFIVRL